MTNVVEQVTPPQPDPMEITYRQRTYVEMIMGETIIATCTLNDAQPVDGELVPKTAVQVLVEDAIEGQKAQRSIDRLGEMVASSAYAGVGGMGMVWSVMEQTDGHTGITRAGLAVATMVSLLISAAGTAVGVGTLRNKTPTMAFFQRRLDTLDSMRQKTQN